MSDIFLSYSSEDLPRLRGLIRALEQHGWSVWWDRTILPGRTFDQAIEEALDAARCVMVVWSQHSVLSDWVKTEAAEGARRAILVPVLLDEVRVPLEFRRIQAARLLDWHDTGPHPEFDRVLLAVTHFLGPPPLTAEEVLESEAATPSVSPQDQPEVHRYTTSDTRETTRLSRRQKGRLLWGMGSLIILWTIVTLFYSDSAIPRAISSLVGLIIVLAAAVVGLVQWRAKKNRGSSHIFQQLPSNESGTRQTGLKQKGNHEPPGYDIFVSYSEDGYPKASELVELMEAQGWSVWRERNVTTGQTFREVMSKGLENAQCIVVLWSRQSVESSWVLDGAREAMEQHILVPVFIERVRPPLYFRPLKTVDLVDWEGSYEHAGLTTLLKDIARILRKSVQLDPQALRDINDIRIAVRNHADIDGQRLAKAIIRRMGARSEPLLLPDFHEGTVWQFHLPDIGLRLHSPRAVFFLRQHGGNKIEYERLSEIVTQQDAALLIIVDVTDMGKPPILQYPPTVWFHPTTLLQMAMSTPEDRDAWLGRYITTQVDIKPILLYQTKGKAEIFFGRELELTRLLRRNRLGGIIVGAHRSGKTSLLYQLGSQLRLKGRQVIGPLSVGGVESVQTFLELTIDELHTPLSSASSSAAWGQAIRRLTTGNECPIFLLDEVDQVLRLDAEANYALGWQMRDLQSDGRSEFYLAGHAVLRKAVAVEGNPFRNFAEEVTLTGLSDTPAARLIQEPVRRIGFEISDENASRIIQGTAGVPVLIQEFCIRLLEGLKSFDTPIIGEAEFKRVESSPEYLDTVYEHFKYAQTRESMSVMLLTSMLGETSRQVLTEKFQEKGILVDRQQLDAILSFLTEFGVLKERALDEFIILPTYLTRAIMGRSSDSLLEFQFEK